MSPLLKNGRVSVALTINHSTIDKYTHLSPLEREQIYVLLQSGYKQKDVAENLNRDPASISREIKRNKSMIGRKNNNNPEAKLIPENHHYLPDRAQMKYLKRRKESKQQPYLKSLSLYQYVIDHLKQRWSPEIISGRAELEGIGKISHESIYQFIYSRKGKELKLYQYLPRTHKYRRKQHGRKSKRTLIPNRIGIENRSLAANKRTEFGHWETDSVLGVGKGPALNTNRERKSRYMIISKIRRKTDEETNKAILKRFKSLPLKARLSNTADNGPEFTGYEYITEKLGLKFYFANPYHSWERGTNENGNGLIRRFFPKKTDFSKITIKEIKVIENWINHRPLKCLDFKTPYEVFHEQLTLSSTQKNCT